MQQEIAQLEPRLKEILYRCMEDIRATKAALYLSIEPQHFHLVTHYGFRELPSTDIDARDDVIDKLLTRRAPFFVNSLAEDPLFSERMFKAQTTRMLLAPIYSRGKLVGFLDLRDKAGKRPFEASDATGAQTIAEQFVELFAQKNLFGQRTVSLVETNKAQPAPITMESASDSAVEEAKRALERGVGRARIAPAIGETHLQAGSTALAALIALPGALIAALSAFNRNVGMQVLAARSVVAPEALQEFQGKLQAWAIKRGLSAGSIRSSMIHPLGIAGSEITSARMSSILSAPIDINGVSGVVLTLAFETAPDASTKELLGDLLRQTQAAVEQSLSRSRLSAALWRTAEKLVEPDFQRYPKLMDHCRRVAELAERLATAAGFPPADVEATKLAALVHDVGMRVLDYAFLYRKPNLTPDEMKKLQQHVVVGAALVAETALGGEIANAVLCHHERPDGTGYPHGLGLEQIPASARIIHICEAYDAMTAADSYQTPVQVSAAIAKIRRSSGSQFDPELAAKFADMMTAESNEPMREG